MNGQNSHSEIRRIEVVVRYFYPIAAGIETNILETYSVLAGSGWKVVVHASRDTYLDRDCLEPEMEIKGLTVKRYHHSCFGFRPEIDWDSADCVCLHNFNIFPHFQLIIRCLWKKIIGRKRFALIITPHGGFNPEWRIFKPWQALVKKHYHNTLGAWLINQAADGVRAVSGWEQAEMIKKGVRPDLIRVIDNGLENEAYADLDAVVGEEFKRQIAAYGDYIIQIGRVYMIKNYETVIRALSLMPNHVNYVIAGPVADKKYKQDLDSLIAELGLRNRVIFAGVVRGWEKYYLISRARMMAHMALWESYCNVVHEGMSQGLVCLVADNTALPALIKDGVNGFVIPTRDYARLAERIKYVLDNFQSPEIQAICQRNFRQGRENSWQKVAQRMDEFYRELAARLF